MQVLFTAVGRSQEKMAPQANLDWQAKLSQREIEVTQAIAKGASNKVVARQLDISERTVKAHVTAIFEKLGVTDRLKLVLLVTEMS
jgi:DNA-binding NarL/FixJ family response regulator